MPCASGEEEIVEVVRLIAQDRISEETVDILVLPVKVDVVCFIQLERSRRWVSQYHRSRKKSWKLCSAACVVAQIKAKMSEVIQPGPQERIYEHVEQTVVFHVPQVMKDIELASNVFFVSQIMSKIAEVLQALSQECI